MGNLHDLHEMRKLCAIQRTICYEYIQFLVISVT